MLEEMGDEASNVIKEGDLRLVNGRNEKEVTDFTELFNAIWHDVEGGDISFRLVSYSLYYIVQDS